MITQSTYHKFQNCPHKFNNSQTVLGSYIGINFYSFLKTSFFKAFEDVAKCMSYTSVGRKEWN